MFATRAKRLLRRRAASESRMAGFWDLPSPADLPGARIVRELGEIRHTITHHRYTLTVALAETRAAKSPFRWFDSAELEGVPLSTTARKALALEAKFILFLTNGLAKISVHNFYDASTENYFGQGGTGHGDFADLALGPRIWPRPRILRRAERERRIERRNLRQRWLPYRNGERSEQQGQCRRDLSERHDVYARVAADAFGDRYGFHTKRPPAFELTARQASSPPPWRAVSLRMMQYPGCLFADATCRCLRRSRSGSHASPATRLQYIEHSFGRLYDQFRWQAALHLHIYLDAAGNRCRQHYHLCCG